MLSFDAYSEQPFATLFVEPLNIAEVGGVSATGFIGTPIKVASGYRVTGVVATGSVGTVTVSADSNHTVTGVVGTLQEPTAQAYPQTNVLVTGVNATAVVNADPVSVAGGAGVSVEGIFATGRIGGVFLWGEEEANNPVSYTEIEPSTTQTWGEITPSTSQSWDEVA